MDEPVVFPPTMFSPPLQSLVTSLLEKDPSARLKDAGEAKQHPYFKKMNWGKLLTKQVQSPVLPYIKSGPSSAEPNPSSSSSSSSPSTPSTNNGRAYTITPSSNKRLTLT
jgi:serum/glucocorticoid-regulated kinase 2